MFNKKTMVLYCGGAPGLAPNAPASPGGGVGASSAAAAASSSSASGPAEAESGVAAGRPAALAPPRPSRCLWGPPPGFAEGPRRAIGPLGGAPRAPIGCPEGPRPASLALTDGGGSGELDGCEDDETEAEGAASSSSEGVPSPSASLDSLPGKDPQEDPQEDPLRRLTRQVVGRYLREAAGQEGGAAKAGGGGGGGGQKFSLQGLLGRLGASAHGGREAEAQAEAEAAAGATRALETLRRVGDGILDKHQLAFQGMLRKMHIQKEADLAAMSEVATEVFRDGVINWGRIVTLISFGAFVAKHLKSTNQEGSVDALAEIITDVLATEKREWLVSHDAWDGFVKFFHVEDIEGGIRNVLMTFAGVAGLGAGLAYMIR